jgi:hypothetical protein
VDPAQHRAEILQREHVPVQERFLRLGGERDMKRPARAWLRAVWGGWGSNPRPADYESAALTG